MAATSRDDISSLITSTPGVCGGRPCLAGTRFPVLELAVHYNAGETAEEVAAAYDLPLASVYAGFAYYLANRATIDADLADEALKYAEGLAEARLIRERASRMSDATSPVLRPGLVEPRRRPEPEGRWNRRTYRDRGRSRPGA